MEKKMYNAGDLEMEETPESAADVGDLETGERFGSVADVGDHGRKSHGFFFVLAAATAPVNKLVVCDCREKKIPGQQCVRPGPVRFLFPRDCEKGRVGHRDYVRRQRPQKGCRTGRGDPEGAGSVASNLCLRQNMKDSGKVIV